MELLTRALVLVALAGCFTPDEPNGALRCGAAGDCPSGFTCASDDFCWRDGTGPDVADATSAPPADATAGPIDAFVPPPPDAPPACKNGLDDDCDGKIDHDDPGCENDADDDEHGTKRCDDDIDNDGDGLIDYHTGCAPPGDPQCDKADDDSET